MSQFGAPRRRGNENQAGEGRAEETERRNHSALVLVVFVVVVDVVVSSEFC